MKPEVRRAALRAAAKTAFVVSIGAVGAIGCGGTQPSPTAPANAVGSAPATTPPAPTAATCAEHLDGLATVKRDALAADDPLRARNDVFGEPFADPSARTSPRTHECCKEELDHDGAQAKHRWACCSAFAQNEQPFACTPWGPPCPPEMA